MASEWPLFLAGFLSSSLAPHTFALSSSFFLIVYPLSSFPLFLFCFSVSFFIARPLLAPHPGRAGSSGGLPLVMSVLGVETLLSCHWGHSVGCHHFFWLHPETDDFWYKKLILLDNMSCFNILMLTGWWVFNYIYYILFNQSYLYCYLRPFAPSFNYNLI